MSKIQRLQPQLIAKIAAGEVIERPAYAVKELVENALDAAATSIRIDIEKGGLEKIMVIDNGDGMSKEDILECYKPHTTSKIVSEHDLLAVKSLGFRGEALASIAAISRLTVISRLKKDKVGNEIIVESSNLILSKSTGAPQGTSILVEELFNSLPGRKKFLKSIQIEFRYILQIISEYALAFPKVRFFLTHNKKIILNLPENQSLSERTEIILGEQNYSYIIPLNKEDIHHKVSGYISKPQLVQTSTQKQYVFVNKRSIKNKMISSVIKQIYGTLLAPDQYPLFILFISLPHDMLDVNVHPRKEEVRFHSEILIKELLTAAVEESLIKYNLTFHDERWKKSVYKPLIDNNSVVRDGSTKTYAAELLKSEELPWKLKEITPTKKFTVIGQVHNLYIVVQDINGLFIFDQHAAHERIIYEQLEKKLTEKQKNKESYKLKKNVILNLSLTDLNVLKSNEQFFESLGFQIVIQESAVVITEVPMIFKDRNVAELLTELVENYNEENIHVLDSRSKRMLAYLACRAAVKAGDALTIKECSSLITQLNKARNPYTCPHGRPIKIEINLKDLSKMFRRS